MHFMDHWIIMKNEASSENIVHVQEPDAKDPEYPICTTAKEAAASIQEHSFCILKIDDDTVRCVEQANELALEFFSNNEPDKIRRYQRIIEGHLHGYNRLPSKLLFRAFCGNSQQPWPTTAFQIASTELADQLNTVVTDCWKELNANIAVSDDDNDAGRTLRPAKRVKSTDGKHDENPLDYFYYHNQNPKAINCSEHIDRGILIAICLSNVPGLQVAKPKGKHGEFVNLEELVSSTESNNYICILAGNQLAIHSNNTVPPCIHRVKQQLSNPRLSISYELRI
jgi:isopenicillin N synthase-like dioxygenase